MTDKAAMAKLADDMIRISKTGDAAALDRLLAPDFVMWHNTTQTEIPRSAIFEVLAGVSATPELDYVDIRRLYSDDGYISQHFVTGRKANGDLFRMPACMVVGVKDGRVTRIDEYFDSAQDPRN